MTPPQPAPAATHARGGGGALAKPEADAIPVAGKLLLMHSHVYYMVELFQDHEDEAALAALKKPEEECF